ncbi:MAG: hypothetical protein ACRDOO_06590 [Actinomadura sp.]
MQTPRTPDPYRPEPYQPAEPHEYAAPGCLTWPARAIAIVIVVPIRLLWEAVAAVGSALYTVVLQPLGRLLDYVIVRPARWLFTVLVVIPLRWLGRVLVVIPLRWVWRAILTPLGRWLYTYVLAPVGRGLRWVVAGLLLIILTPVGYVLELIGKGLRALYRWARPALAAIGRVIVDALSFAWGVATAVVRFLGTVLYHTVVRPVRWVWRTTVRPVLVATGTAVAWTWRVAVASPTSWVRRNLL